MKRSAFLIAMLLTLGASVTLAAAGAPSIVKIRATLTAKQEVPPQRFKVANASGSFLGTLTKTRKGYRLAWRLTFNNLSSGAKSAYIHKGRPGKYGPAYFHLCSPCRSGAHGSAYASPGEVSLMNAGRMYVNIRTARNPAGEIRGQIKVY